MIKSIIQNILNAYGYRISRNISSDPFIDMQSLLLQKKEDEPIIFDVGAHHGSTTKLFRDLSPNSIIYAFEPFQSSFTLLKKNTESDPKIYAINLGLSNVAGWHAFNSNLSSETNSLLMSDELGAKSWGTGLLETQEIVEAEFKTLDSVVEEMSIPKIDILKMDCQGAEPLVMLGGVNTLRKVSIIYSEIIVQPTYKGQKRFDEFLATFYNSNFDLYNLYNLSYSSNGRLIQVDAIFTKVL